MAYPTINMVYCFVLILILILILILYVFFDFVQSQPRQSYAMKYQSRNQDGRVLADKEIATYGSCILEVCA